MMKALGSASMLLHVSSLPLPPPAIYIPSKLKRHGFRQSPSLLRAQVNDTDSKGNPDPNPTPTSTSLPEELEYLEYLEARAGVGRRKARRSSSNAVNPNTNIDMKKKKDWESMTLQEKVVEIYAGEKGILFWLNKFAYASIFIVIGGWILFRFVGPSLGFYELQSPLLEPTKAFGS